MLLIIFLTLRAEVKQEEMKMGMKMLEWTLLFLSGEKLSLKAWLAPL